MIKIFIISYFLTLTTSHEYRFALLAQPHYISNNHRATQQIYFQIPKRTVTPLTLMVDVTNQFGFNILAYHSQSNSNNVAFSPCGLGSVMVALFEGCDGRSSFEIYKALNFPWDRDVVRVGYRDIHRRLRGYFYQQENLLSGLSLSRDNVIIRSSYEIVLRFYGYDLSSANDAMVTKKDQNTADEVTTISSIAKDNQTEVIQAEITTTAKSTTTYADDVTTTVLELSTMPKTEPTTLALETKTIIPILTSTDKKEPSMITTTAEPPPTTSFPDTTTPIQGTTILLPMTEATTNKPAEISTKIPETTTNILLNDQKTTISNIQQTSTPAVSYESTSDITNNTPKSNRLNSYPTTTEYTNNFQTTTVFPLQSTKYTTSQTTYEESTDSTLNTTPLPSKRFTTAPTTYNPFPTSDFTNNPQTTRFNNYQTTEMPTTTMFTDPTTTSQPRTTMYIFTFKPIPNTPLTATTTQYPKRLYNSLPATTTPVPALSRPSSVSQPVRNERLQKRSTFSKRSYFQLTPTSSGYGISSDFDSFFDPYGSDVEPLITPNPPAQQESYTYDIKTNSNFDQNDQQQDEIVNHIFYLNKHESIQVGYRVYNTLLKYAYIDSIQASVLELPLDSENYNLLLIVPDQPYGLNSLTEKLTGTYAPTLRDIRAKLKLNWLKATIPKFQVKGKTVLTPDLMKMGIHDIFEPNKADFSPMTEESGIYAKHIEQDITINIRTQPNNQLKRLAELYYNPISISVNQPFIFGIIDTEMDLAIMIGRILNPLNSRIF